MKIAKFLFWLGIFVMVVGVICNIYTSAHVLANVVSNTGAFITSIISPLWQGGLLIGLAKVVEILSSKRN